MRLKSPLFSFSASKQLGKALIYKMKGARAFATAYNKPGGQNPNKPSATQLDNRMLYNLILARWQTLSAGTKATWNEDTRATSASISGWNLFYQQALLDLPTHLGLQGYWSFNRIVGDEVLDLSGNDNHGVLEPTPPTDAPELVDSVGAKFGKALDFNGTSDYVDCGTATELDFTTGDFSIEFWIKPDNADGNSIFLCRGKYNTDGWYLYHLNFKVYFTTSSSGVFKQSISEADLENGTWSHIVTTRTGAVATLYVNGIERTSSHATHADPASNPARELWIGQYESIGYKYNGALDNILIFNRLLSQEEITKHYKLITKK